MIEENPHQTKGPRVLIIDDSRSIQQYVTELLEKSGYTVSNAFDGLSGLEMIAATDPDVVLLDVEMPEMDGLQVLGKLSKTQHLFAVIMFTTKSSLEHIVEGLTSGADDYITKPFQAMELLARVASAERSVALKRELALARQKANDSLMRLHKAQAQLVEEKKIQAISRLAAGVAHEINNPLGFIMSNLSTLQKYSEYLLQFVCYQAENTHTTNLNTAETSLIDHKKLNSIRRDLIPLLAETQEGFSRIAEIVKSFTLIESAVGGLKAQKEDINDIITAIVKTTQHLLPPAKRLTLKPAATNLPIMGNLTMLNLLFTNIINNAIEATDDVSEITILTSSDEANVICKISDSGYGIATDNLSHIFDPFFTTKAGGGHFGLGLTVAECFVNAHLGTVKATSNATSGTEIIVSLPMLKE
ncbi:MAG: response regulator [Desulfuromonadaceae bacterium]|nr:response regulator [Desulfuromonadaceae bacterium]MDD2855861.1 response regulator [Desulfuromonadaceae bacterium]